MKRSRRDWIPYRKTKILGRVFMGLPRHAFRRLQRRISRFQRFRWPIIQTLIRQLGPNPIAAAQKLASDHHRLTHAPDTAHEPKVSDR